MVKGQQVAPHINALEQTPQEGRLDMDATCRHAADATAAGVQLLALDVTPHFIGFLAPTAPPAVSASLRKFFSFFFV